MISHKHRCVFVHIPKCGGQSVEHLFVQENCLTWDTRAGLLLRPNDDPRRGPPRLAHLTWQDYIKFGYISAELMHEYTTFSVVRNPYKRVQSLYGFLGYDAAISFERFVTEVLTKQIEGKGDLYWFVRPQHEYLCSEDGSVKVDQVIKLEEINKQLPRFLRSLGIEKQSIPHVNKAKDRGTLRSIKARLLHARSGVYSWSPKVESHIVWDDSIREKVLELYKHDFKKLNYSPNDRI